jgi:hypothetical protein
MKELPDSMHHDPPAIIPALPLAPIRRVDAAIAFLDGRGCYGGGARSSYKQ